MVPWTGSWTWASVLSGSCGRAAGVWPRHAPGSLSWSARRKVRQMTIEAAILNLQAKWLSIDGVNSAPDYPPESPGAYPFAVTYERRGRLAGRSFGFGDEIALLFSELHVARTMLPRDIQSVMPFRDQFIAL